MRQAEYPRTQDAFTNVAVIGAGIAGVTAGAALHAQGHRVTLFDKARGVGGRMSLRRRDQYEFDHGAQYFTVRDERLAKRIPDWTTAGIAAPWSGRIVALASGRQELRDSPLRYVGVPGMNAIVKYLARDLPLHVETGINQIRWNANHWQLIDTDSRSYGEFEALIVTPPAPQTAKLLAGHSPLADAARSCRLSPCWAVMLSFEQPIRVDFDAAFVADSPLSWIARNSSKSGRPASDSWVLHAGPTWSTQHLEDRPDTIVAALTNAFFEAVRTPGREPNHAHAHRWRYALPEQPLEVGCLWDAERNLAVAGDWCHGARVEGAFLSGLEAAERINQAAPQMESHA